MKLLSRLTCWLLGHYFPIFDEHCLHCGAPRPDTDRTWQKEDGL